jgi:anti-sigma B factor antagonist
MPNEPDIIQVTDRNGVKLVRIMPDAILREQQVEALGAALEPLADVPGQRVVLSFLGVHQLTSLALGKLIHIHRRLAASHGELRLADIDPRLYEIFAITHLDRLFKIFEREDDALASFAGKSET